MEKSRGLFILHKPVKAEECNGRSHSNGMEAVVSIEGAEHAQSKLLERYAMHFMSEEECEALEDHLMSCVQCQEKLEAVQRFVSVVREAFRIVRAEAPRGRLSLSQRDVPARSEVLAFCLRADRSK